MEFETRLQQLEAVIAQMIVDGDLQHQVVHGDENTTVTTETGTLNSLAREAALRVLNGMIYDDTAAGLAAVGEGSYFSVPDTGDDNYLVLYRHDAGTVATEIKRYPSADALTAGVAAAAQSASGAQVSATASKDDADRALNERQQITDQLSLVLAAAAQVADDKAFVTSALIGDEDYVIPAVTQLLATYSNVVDTAISDDVWAEYAHRWGAPKRVLAVAETDRVVLHDLTKPSIPVWRSYANDTSFLSPNRTITSVFLARSVLLIGRGAGAAASNGVYVADFCTGIVEKIEVNAAYHALIPIDGTYNDASNIGGLSIIDSNINGVAAHIPDDAPKHPVTGLPMPTIAVATSGGASELVPDSAGDWSVRNLTDYVTDTTIKAYSVAYINGELHVAFYSSPNARGGVAVYREGAWQRGYGRHTNGNLKYHAGTIEEWIAYRSSSPIMPTGLSSRLISSQYHDGSWKDGPLIVRHDNPSDAGVGMRAFVAEDYSTPLLVGDVQAALLCDSVEGVITGGELVPNGTFDTDTSGWAPFSGAPAAVAEGGRMKITATAAFGKQECVIATTPGETYVLEGDQEVGTAANVRIYAGPNQNGNQYLEKSTTSNSHIREEFVATSSFVYISVRTDSASDGGTGFFDNISLTPAVPDRSGRGNAAAVNGTLSRSKPAGADVAVWSGFSAINYLSGADPQLGTGDFCISANLKGNTGNKEFLTIGPSTVTNENDGLHIWAYGNAIKIYCDAIYLEKGDLPVSYPLSIVRRGTTLEVWVDGVMGGSVDITGANVAGLLTVGKGFYPNPMDEISCLSISKTAPSADQIRDLHRDMLTKLSKPSMLTGTVKALAHDAVRGDDWIACSDGQIHRLTRGGTTFEESINTIDGIAISSVGNISSLKVVDGAIVVAGDAGVLGHVPALNRRAPEVKRGKSVQPFELGVGDTEQTDFYLPYGWKPKRVYMQGLKVREGTGEIWTAQYDGYRWFARFNVAPAVYDIDCDAVEV